MSAHNVKRHSHNTIINYQYIIYINVHRMTVGKNYTSCWKNTFFSFVIDNVCTKIYVYHFKYNRIEYRYIEDIIQQLQYHGSAIYERKKFSTRQD